MDETNPDHCKTGRISNHSCCIIHASDNDEERGMKVTLDVEDIDIDDDEDLLLRRATSRKAIVVVGSAIASTAGRHRADAKQVKS